MLVLLLGQCESFSGLACFFFYVQFDFSMRKKKKRDYKLVLNLFTLYEASLTTCTVNLEVMSSIIDVCMLFFWGMCARHLPQNITSYSTFLTGESSLVSFTSHCHAYENT